MLYRLLALFALLHSANALVINAPLPANALAATTGRAGATLMMAKKEGKKVKVMLEKDVSGLGVAGSIVEVKPAYAENFIVSNGMGVKATKDMLERVAKEEAEAAAKAKAAKAKAEEDRQTLQAKFGNKGLIIDKQVDKEGEIDSSVTAGSVCAELVRAGVAIEEKNVEMPDITVRRRVSRSPRARPHPAASAPILSHLHRHIAPP